MGLGSLESLLGYFVFFLARSSRKFFVDKYFTYFIKF